MTVPSLFLEWTKSRKCLVVECFVIIMTMSFPIKSVDFSQCNVKRFHIIYHKNEHEKKTIKIEEDPTVYRVEKGFVTTAIQFIARSVFDQNKFSSVCVQENNMKMILPKKKKKFLIPCS